MKIVSKSLPNDWQWVRLEDLLVEKPCNGLYKPSEFLGKGVLFLDINGLYKGLTTDFSNARRVEVTEDEYKQYELVEGDILFNRVSKMPEGVGKAVLVDLIEERAVYESNMIRVRVNQQRVDSLFIIYYLSTSQSRQELLSKANISNQASINQQAIKSLKIPLPRLEEQCRIVAILDKADAVRRKRQSAIALTEELLRSAFLEMFGDPVTNPKGWEVHQLEDFSAIQSGIAKGKKIEQSKAVSVPYMRVANVQDGYIDLSEIKEIKVLPPDVNKYTLQEGDLLLTEGGDPDKLGRGSVWYGEIQPCIHQNHIFCVRPDRALAEPEYLSALIGSDRGKKYFLQAAKQTTGIATINKTQLRTFPALLPPLYLQQKGLSNGLCQA